MADSEVNPFAKFVATPTSVGEENPFAKFSKAKDVTSSKAQVTAPSEPESTSGIGTFFREGILAAPATAAGIGAGEAATVAAVPFMGPAAPLAGLVAGGAVGFGVNYLGESGLNALEGMDPLAQRFMKMVGVDKATREAGRKEHEYTALAGQLASGGPFVSTAAKSLMQRVVGGTIQAGVGAGTRASMGEDQDWKKSLIEFGGGATLAGGLTKTGQRIPGAKKVVEPAIRPPEGATAEERAAFIQELEAIKTKRTETAPLIETGMKNTKTGEEIKMGPKHDQAKKDELKNDPDWQEGFFDERGNFHERQAAVDQAKRSGQLPEDHVLENPPGERGGLHSGDMRKVGDKRFEITTEKPVGKTRENYKTDITKNENERINLKIEEQKAKLANDNENAQRLKEQIDKLEAEHAQLVKDMPEVKFKNKSAPTHEEWHDHVWGSKTLGEAIDKTLATKELGGLGQRVLMKALRQSEFISNAKLELTKDTLKYTDKSGKEKNALGLYYGGSEHRVQLGKGSSVTELLHEAMHAGTQKLLLDKTSPAAIEMHKLFDKYQQDHIVKYEEALQRFKEDNPNATLEELNKFKEQNDPYGFENVDEFVAEAFTNKEFQRLLSGLDVRDRPSGVISNLWDSFKEIVRLNLGVPENARSAFDDVIEHGSNLIEESKRFKRDVNGNIVISPSRLSQEIHDELEREGIAIAHTSPHKFGMFDWVKHALSGEGANAFGAGTYGSQKDSTNTYYVEMAKQKALDKYLESPEGKADQIKLDALKYESFAAAEKVGDINYELKRAVQQLKSLEDQLVGPEGASQKEWAKRKIQEQEAEVEQLEEELLVAKEESNEKDYEFEATVEELTQKIKVPTYHSSIKASSEELLDWDSKNQSDLVTSAFKNLGVESANNLDKTTELKINQALKDGWYGNLKKDGRVGVTVLGRDYIVEAQKIKTSFPDGTTKDIDSLVVHGTGEVVTSFEQAKKSVLEMIYQDQGYTKKTGEQLYRELSVRLEPKDAVTRNLITDREARQIGMAKASIALAEQGVVGNVHNAQGGTEQKFRNYVVFDDSRITQNFVVLASRERKTTPSSSGEPTTTLKDRTKTSEPVAKEFEKLDPRSMPSEEAMLNHATDIYERYGEADAIQFFDDYKKNLNERSIPVPNDAQGLDDFLHKMGTYKTKDRSEHVVGYKENTDKGVTEEQRAKWFDMREQGLELPPEGKAVLDAIDAENIALVRKAKAMGLEVGEEFTTGQSRIRLFSEKDKPGWKEAIKKFFSNETPMGDKVADQADAAIERKVYETSDGRVIEFHRQTEDVKTPTRDIKKGTEIFEWKDGQKRLIEYSEDLNFKRGDKFTTKDGKEVTVVDAKVPNIERNSPYRYLHDAEASARIANMGLRKMVREAEAIESLKKSELFKQVGHGPEQDLKTLPKHWVVPSNIDSIPQLRGWHFDPKTAAIISDFAKVWDNSMYMKLNNALVKNMMLNPVPHMFNEVMHLWNARGFSGWVMPGRLGTFADTARVAWRDVGNQTQFYRDIMREGGSILGADPRNKGYFDVIQKEASKQMFGTPEMEKNMSGLAKKLGVPVANLYNGISEASQKAMWFTRDVMYVQLVREIMARQEKSTGVKMELKDAIYQAERHMPNYRLPSEVMGSRSLSKVLRNPNVSMFARYHYGMVKSLVNTLKDVDPRNLRTPEGREHFREGVDSMLAIGVAMAALYPLMDMMAEKVFGEGAEQRRAGPYHLIKAGMDVATGEKDASALIWPVFTFNPMLLSLGQLAFNKKIFNGKEIYHPDDSIGDIASDIGEYAVKQIPQASPIMSATSGEDGGDTKLIARQLDIKAKSEKDLQREARAKAYQQRTKKGRDTKRDKGTYKP